MRINTLRIRNFRSIRDLEVKLQPLTMLIGRNNTGKSNLIRALQFFFESSVKLSLEDICQTKQEDECEIFVDITFSTLSEQEKNTFKQYIMPDATFRVRKITLVSKDQNDNIKLETRYDGLQLVPTEPALNPNNADNYKTKDARESLKKEKGIDFAPYLPEKKSFGKGDIQEAQAKYIANNYQILTFTESWVTPFMGIASIGSGLLGDFMFVPAVRDVSEETKVQDKAFLGKLLNRAISLMAEEDQDFGSIKQQLETLVNRFNADPSDPQKQRPGNLTQLEQGLKESLSDWDVRSVSITVTPPSLDKVFQMGTSIEIDDGVLTSPGIKGHGLQRAVIFALTKSWAEIIKADKIKAQQEELKPRAASESLFYAIEEPELYLHPHAQRIMLTSLLELAQQASTQVIISTHSSYFIDLDNYKSILIMRKDSPNVGTKAFQVSHDLWDETVENGKQNKTRFKLAYWFNPDRAEVFFAKKIVLVEGQTEKVCLRYIAGEKLGLNVNNISIVDCGGKDNIPLYIDLLNAFSLPYIVIHDEDPITVDVNNDKYESQKRTFNLNAVILSKAGSDKVHCICPRFEAITGASNSQCKILGKALANFCAIIEDTFIPNERVKLICNKMFDDVTTQSNE